MSRLASDLRLFAYRLVLAGYLAIAPSTVPPWRVAPDGPRPVAMLMVGEPVPMIGPPS